MGNVHEWVVHADDENLAGLLQLRGVDVAGHMAGSA